jgi:Tn3 transposase DDE domain
VDLFENITQGFTTAGNREILSREIIRKRLLLSIFAIGTNTVLKRINGASLGKVTHEDLRHIKRFFLNADELWDDIEHVFIEFEIR